MNALTWLMVGLGGLVGVVLGGLAHWGWTRRQRSQKLRLPARWLMPAQSSPRQRLLRQRPMRREAQSRPPLLRPGLLVLLAVVAATTTLLGLR